MVQVQPDDRRQQSEAFEMSTVKGREGGAPPPGYQSGEREAGPSSSAAAGRMHSPTGGGAGAQMPGRQQTSSQQPLVYEETTGAGSSGGACSVLLTMLSYLLIFITFPFSLIACLKVVQEYERAVIFRLGRLLPGGAKGPGLFFIVPCIDSYRSIDLRVLSYDIPPQEILTKDSVTVKVDAVVYYRIVNPTASVLNVQDAAKSTKLLAQTNLRTVLGTKTLSEMLAHREDISTQMQTMLGEATQPWGIHVERVEVKDFRLPVDMQRSMAAEAEATREARAKMIAAEGERNASRALREAADVMETSPATLQLRYLQTLNTISTEKNTTVIFPFPMDMISAFLNKNTGAQSAQF